MRIVLSNIPAAHAEPVARTLVEERLAACVSLLPVTSVFRWDGEVQTEAEVTLLIKVGAEAVGPLRERLRQLHPYSLPEIVCLPVEGAGSLGAYVDWVRAESGGGLATRP